MILYSHLRYAIHFLGVALNICFYWLVLHAGLSARYRDIAVLKSKNFFVQCVVYYGLLVITAFSFFLPLRIYSGYWLEHYFGVSSESSLQWCSDTAKAFCVDAVLGVLGFYLFFLIVRKFPRHWPAVFGLVSVPITIFLTFCDPLIFDPIFNKFVPMAPCALRSDIEKLLARAEVRDAPIFIADKSKQTNKFNAYVTGIGGSARVVMYDTLIDRMPADQALSVVAHELGHYKLHHVYWGLAIAFLFEVMAVFINYAYARKFVALLPASWRIKGLSDLAVTPALFLVGCVGGFVCDPLDSWISRTMEHQADEYDLALFGNREAMAKSFITLSKQNLSEPDPPGLIEFWMFSHPSLKKRIDFALHGSSQFGTLHSPPAVSE
jgi:Zn-dependent protease with chaperone function